MSRTPSSSPPVFTRRTTTITRAGPILLLTATRTTATTSDNVAKAHPAIPIPQTRGARTVFAAGATAPDGDFMPDAPKDVVEEVVEEGEDPGCDVDDGEDYLVWKTGGLGSGSARGRRG